MPRPRIGVWAFAGIAGLSVAIGIWLASVHYGAREAAPEAARILYAQRWPAVGAGTFDAASLRGRPVLVNFWATWCGPCVEEMPELQALSEEFSQTPVRFIGVGVDSADNIADFRVRHRIGYPLLVAGAAGTELARQFGNAVGALPYTVILDADGRVKYQKMGRVYASELRPELQRLLR